jgi:hypothetical protein
LIALLVSLSSAFGAPTQRLANLPPNYASQALTRTEASDEFSVTVKSEHLTGSLPGLTVEVRLNASLSGDDQSSLAGEGRHFSSTGAHSYWPATGAISGTSVTIHGTVTESNLPVLINSPVEIAADSATDQITMYFGPIAGGPFAGQTLVLTGTGRVTIKGDD